MENKKSLVYTADAAPAAAYAFDLSIADQEVVVVWWTLADAGAAADLTAATCLVRLYDPSGTAVMVTLAEDLVLASGAFTSPVAMTAKRYDTRGLNKLRVQFTTTAVKNIRIYTNSFTYS